MGRFRERLSDLWAGIGWCHFADPAKILPDGFPTANLCGKTKRNGEPSGAWLIWWFTPTCPRCKRRADEC